MITFELKMPKAEIVGKATALIVTADGTGSRTRKRQVGTQIVDRQIPVSGVLTEKRCALVPVYDGSDAPEPKILGYEFDGIDAKPFKLAKGKATGVPKKGHVDLDIPLDFAGAVLVMAELDDGESVLVQSIECATKED